MMLLIDAGNTRIKFGWVERQSGRRETAALTLDHAALDRLPRWLAQLPAPPVAALGVNVAGASICAAIESCLALHACPIAWVTSGSEALGVRNRYQSPDQLGADRWVSMLALAQRAQDARAGQTTGREPESALMLASFGTATTIDTLSPHLSFEGGLILPGPELMRTSLAQATANLPQARGETTAYPTDTHRAIATGIAAAQAGAVLRQWLIGLEHYGRAPRIYSAGGGWPIVQQETLALLAAAQTRLGLPITAIEWLAAPVLDGLARLACEQ